MPVSSTTPGPAGARAGAPVSFAFHNRDSVGTQDTIAIAAQWLACTFPYRRFADTLAAACARLGADVARYTFIAVDLHHFLLAGLPAHPETISRFGGAGRARCGVAPHLCGSPHGARSALHRIPNISLRELQGWQLVKLVQLAGDRRDHFKNSTELFAPRCVSDSASGLNNRDGLRC
jgi:hypothetical protein